MPLFSDHITNMYYSGSPSYSSAPYGYSSSVLPFGSSYSASYLNPGGSYSTHSSLGGYSRPTLTSRWVTSSGRNYSPMLSTISERGSSSPVRITSPRRVTTISKRSYPSTSYTPRPININTADIDVSREKYRSKVASTSTATPISAPPQKEPPKASTDQDGPFMPRIDGKPETGVDSSPGKHQSTIKRGRTVVRLHTLKRKERDSPRKPQADDAQSTQQDSTVETENISESSQVSPSESMGWREKLSDDLIYIDKREKKTLGAKLVEKFIVKDKDDDVPNPKNNQEDNNSLPVTPLPTNISRSPDRRCSVEMLAEQANLLDSLIRSENLSTATLDLSKVGISDESKTNNEVQMIKRRKSYDPDNPLKTTKSDHSLHESMKSFRDNKDPKHFSKRRSLKKSSSGGSICRLDSITEFPRDFILTDLPAIEESRLSIKRDSIKPKPKTKLKPKITSSVEITEPKIPLKFRVENVTVEEKTRSPKKRITYSSVVDDTPLQNKTTINENISIKPRRSKVRYDSKKRSKTLTLEEGEPIPPEPEDCNFWDKIGKRETVYLMKRKQILEDSKEKHRRALYWFPVEEDSSINNDNENNDFQYFDADSMQPQCSETNENEPVVVVDKSVESRKLLLLTNCNTDDQGNIKPSTEKNEEILDTNTSAIALPKASEQFDKQKLSCNEEIDVSHQSNTDNSNENHTILENREHEIKAPECVKDINEVTHVNNTQSPYIVLESVVLVTRTMPSVKNFSEECNKNFDVHNDNSLDRISEQRVVPEQNVSDLKGSELTENRLSEKNIKETIQEDTDKPKSKTISMLSETLNMDQKSDSKPVEEKHNPTQIKCETNDNECLLENAAHLKMSECIEHIKTPEKSNLEPNHNDINKSRKTNNTSSVSANIEQKSVGSKTLNTIKTIKETEKWKLPQSDDSKEGKSELNECSTKKKSVTNEIIGKVKLPETNKGNIVPVKRIPEQSSKAKIENITGSSEKGGLKKKQVNDANTPQINVDSKVQVKCSHEQTCKNSVVVENTLQLTKNKDSSKVCNNESPPASTEQPVTEISVQSSSSNLSFKSEPPEKSNLNKKQSEGSLNNSDEIRNQEVTSGNVPKLEIESENIPNNNSNVICEPAVQEQKTGEVKKDENLSEVEVIKEDTKQLSPKGFTKLLASPKKPIKEEPALRPLIATPRPLQKKVPQVIHSSSSSETSSDEESSEEDDSDESDASGNSAEFFECENNPDGRTSTGSNDSGFDSSAPTSPAAFIQIKKGGESPGTSAGNAPTQPGDATDILEQELEQSTAYSLFRKTGRFTPPARSIPRFRKYIIDDFQFIKVLGKGSFGKVLLAELRDTEYYYAVKCLKKDVVLEDDDVECTLIERKVLALGTNHPYLCHLFATFQSDSHLFFVMEYLNGGDLMFHIQQSGRFPELRARFYAAEIVSGLKFLHKRGIVYRDLKLDNILLDFDGHVRIADFGMCKLQIYLEKTADTFCGTPDYMAPEIIKGLKYNQTVDWWSFGVLLYEMLIGQSPFSGCDEDELFWSICNEMPSYPRFLSQEALAILTRLLDKDARTRLGGTECMHGDIREQDFFHAIHWERLERRELEAPFKPRVRHPLDTQYFDRAFTGERPRLTAVEPHVLRSMDQEPFRGFSYTNPNATDR